MSHAQDTGPTARPTARQSSEHPAPAKPSLTDVLFDLRTVIGALFLVYGLVCTIWGITSFSTADSQRTGGVNLNLWAGLGMLVVGALFLVWSIRKPVLPVATDPSTDDAPDGVESSPPTRR